MIDHTGDAGAIVYGNTREELFINAAIAMFDLMIDSSTVEMKISRDIEVDGEDIENMLVLWLSELNYHVSTNREVYSRFAIERLTEKLICATAFGEVIDPARHEMLAEIKAVTYHGLYIKETDDGFEACVIFDL